MNDGPPDPPPTELAPGVIHQAIVEGSRPALAKLYDHYEGKVRYSVARAAFKGGYAGEVEELCQETWCRFLDKDRRLLRYYDPTRGRFSFYIGWVAYQQATDAMNRRRRRALGELKNQGDDLADDEAGRFPDDVIQSDFLRRVLDAVAAQLSAEDQLLLREHHLYGRTLRDIARELGIPETTLHQRNRRLKGKLLRIVEPLLVPPRSQSSAGPTIAASLVVLLIVLLSADDYGLDTGASPMPMMSPAAPIHSDEMV